MTSLEERASRARRGVQLIVDDAGDATFAPTNHLRSPVVLACIGLFLIVGVGALAATQRTPAGVEATDQVAEDSPADDKLEEALAPTSTTEPASIKIEALDSTPPLPTTTFPPDVDDCNDATKGPECTTTTIAPVDTPTTTCWSSLYTTTTNCSSQDADVADCVYATDLYICTHPQTGKPCLIVPGVSDECSVAPNQTTATTDCGTKSTDPDCGDSSGTDTTHPPTDTTHPPTPTTHECDQVTTIPDCAPAEQTTETQSAPTQQAYICGPVTTVYGCIEAGQTTPESNQTTITAATYNDCGPECTRPNQPSEGALSACYNPDRTTTTGGCIRFDPVTGLVLPSQSTTTES